MRNGKTDMMKRVVRKIILYSFHPLIGKNFYHRKYRSEFYEDKENDNILIRMLWTSIFMITQFLRITTRKHLLYCPDDIVAKRIFMPG